MKIKIKTRHIILFIFLCLIYYFNFCFNIFEGNPGFSESMQKAKTKGVFAGEYKINKDSVQIVDNYYLTFRDIWLEKSWSQGQHHGDVIISTGSKEYYHLYFEIPDQKLELVNNNYYLEFRLIRDSTEDILGIQGAGKKIFLVISDNYEFFNKPIKLLVIKPNTTMKDSAKSLWAENNVIDSFYVIKKN